MFTFCFNKFFKLSFSSKDQLLIALDFHCKYLDHKTNLANFHKIISRDFFFDPVGKTAKTQLNWALDVLSVVCQVLLVRNRENQNKSADSRVIPTCFCLSQVCSPVVSYVYIEVLCQYSVAEMKWNNFLGTIDAKFMGSFGYSQHGVRLRFP